jgi:hypothetical protein
MNSAARASAQDRERQCADAMASYLQRSGGPSAETEWMRRSMWTFVRGAQAGAFGYALAAVMIAACAGPQPGGEADSAPAQGAAPPAAAAARDTAAASQGGVTLTLDRGQYAAGDPVTLRIENRSGGGLGYNACTRAVERREGAGWVAVKEDRICTMELRLLGSGETATERTELPSPLPAGEYRLALAMSREEPAPAGAGPIRATSAAFEVP